MDKKKKKEQEEYAQTESEKKLVHLVQYMYRKSYDNMSDQHSKWEDMLDSHTGKYFEENLPSYKSQNISNFVFSTIETIKPVMLANNPEFTVLPSDNMATKYILSQNSPDSPENTASPFDKAKKANACLHYEWNRTKMFNRLHESLTTGLLLGKFIIFLGWNGKEIDPLLIQPFNFYVDEMATSIKDAQYCIYANYVSIKDVIDMAPEKEALIKENASAPTDKYLAFNKDTNNADTSQSILYVEAYIKDYTMLVEEFEEGGEKYTKTRMKYPRGRRVIIAGDVLLSDGENPYNDPQNNNMPFVEWNCYPVPGKFYGMGEAEQIISPTKYANKIINNILESARLNSNPVWIIDKNSGVAKNSLSNRDGLVIRKNPGTDVRREAPPALPAYLMQVPQMLTSHIENISGVYDVTRGERPAGITAAAAIQALNEQAQGRIRLKVQALESTIQDLGSMWLRRITQFWKTDRVIRVANDDSGLTMEEQQYEVVTPDDIDGDFDVEVHGGSIMMSNHTAKQQIFIQLAQTMAEDGMPMIDRQSMLETMSIPRVKEILSRFEKVKQEQQQIQAMMQENEQLKEMLGKSSEMLGINEDESLQNPETPLQSEGEEVDETEQMDKEALLAIMQELQDMSPEQIAQAVENDPRLEVVIELMQEQNMQTEQPTQGIQ